MKSKSHLFPQLLRQLRGLELHAENTAKLSDLKGQIVKRDAQFSGFSLVFDHFDKHTFPSLVRYSSSEPSWELVPSSSAFQAANRSPKRREEARRTHPWGWRRWDSTDSVERGKRNKSLQRRRSILDSDWLPAVSNKRTAARMTRAMSLLVPLVVLNISRRHFCYQ